MRITFPVLNNIFSGRAKAANNLQCDRLFEAGRKREVCISVSISNSKLSDDRLNDLVEKLVAGDQAIRDGEKQRDALKANLEAEAEKTNALQLKLLKPGMSFATVLALYPFASCSQKPVGNVLVECLYIPVSSNSPEKKHLELETLAGNGVRGWSIKFAPGEKLGYALAIMDSSAFDDVSKALAAKYGNATNAKTIEFQNVYGAKLKGSSLTWRRGDIVLEVRQFAEDRETMSLLISSISVVQRIEKIDGLKAKRDAKDL